MVGLAYNVPTVQDRIRFIFKVVEIIKIGMVREIRDWMGANLDGRRRSRQKLYLSNTKTKDGLPIKDPKYDKRRRDNISER